MNRLVQVSDIAALLEDLGEGVTVHDSQGALVYANRAAAASLGFDSVEALLAAAEGEVAARVTLVGPWGQPRSGRLPWDQILSGAGEREALVEHRPAGAREVRVALIRSRAIQIAGRDERLVLSSFRDVTQERQRAANARFLGEASMVLAGSLDYEETLQRVANLAVPLLGDWCAVEIVDDERTSVEQVAVAHVDPGKVALARELRRAYPLELSNPEKLPRALRFGEPELYPEIPLELQLQGVTDPNHVRLITALYLKSGMIVPLKARGAVIGIVTLVSSESDRRFDESDLRLAEELASRAAYAVDNARLYARAVRAVQLRDEFLSIASHELKTPITSLSLHLRQIERRARMTPPDPAAVEHSIAVAYRQVNRLTHLIERLLDVARLHEGKLELERQRCDLSEIAAAVVARFEAESDSLGVPIALRAEPVIGRWDAHRLDQVVTNLVANALKYGERTPVTIRVWRQSNEAHLAVTDSGKGIGEGDLARLFRPFERGAPVRSGGGLGLGLYITSQIVQAHGGSIRVESAPGTGATFAVTLPLE